MVRNVKIISVFLAVVLIFSFPLSCFAAEDLSPGESLMWDNFFNTLGEINKVAITCPKCGAGIRKKDGGTCPSCGFNASIDDGTVNNYRPGFEAGGGSASPGGVGRNPKGYSDNGKANITSNGSLLIWAEPVGITGTWCASGFRKSLSANVSDNTLHGAAGSGERYFNTPVCNVIYSFTAPVTGLYYLGSVYSPYEFGSFSYFDNDWFSNKLIFTTESNYAYSLNFQKGEIGYFTLEFRSAKNLSPYKYNLVSIPLCVEPMNDNSVVFNSNITINNNTFNGNIYVDSSNKLTYIYPQYTVNNETKISNNPIIYNEETKQYYTYDQTTNNYYYITFGDPAPTPTPSPSPDPGGSGGGSSGGDGSGGGSGDTPSGGGSSWWEKLLDKLGSALIDGLLDAIKGILKLLFDLFSSILGWIIWLCSKVFDLFPFLPPGVGALLVGGVVVCFILAFIKFIRG